MEKNARLLADEWPEFQKERQRLVGEIAELKGAVRLLLEKSDIQDSFQIRNQHKKFVDNLKTQIEDCEYLISARGSLLKLRRQAMTDKSLQQELADRLERRRSALQRLKELDVPNFVLKEQERLIWEI